MRDRGEGGTGGWTGNDKHIAHSRAVASLDVRAAGAAAGVGAGVFNADGLFCVAMGKAARRPPQGRLPTRAARGMEE